MKLEILMPSALDAVNIVSTFSCFPAPTDIDPTAIASSGGSGKLPLTSISLDPVFYSKSERANGPAIRVTHESKLLFLGVLRISGESGDVTLRELKPVEPDVKK